MYILNSHGDICYPIEQTVNIDKLNESVSALFIRLGISKELFLKDLEKYLIVTLNISHLSTLTGTDRWKKYAGNHPSLIAQSVSEIDFTQFLTEMDDLYIKEVLDDIFAYHENKFGKKFQGRCQLIASRSPQCYKMHKDLHTSHRYHIPLETDERFLWLFEDDNKDIALLHMPSDGRIWYLNPMTAKHTVIHVGSDIRFHILLTSSIIQS